jgi:hypothetical protein
MGHDELLREQLIELLKGGHAHASFDKIVEGFPLEKIGVRPAGMARSAWELLEHIRIAQNDILRFSESADYVSPNWPDEYWPSSQGPAKDGEWDSSIKSFRKDLEAFEKLVKDPHKDLYRPFPWGDGQTLLREALLIADHNSYHLGQLLLARRALGAWSE